MRSAFKWYLSLTILLAQVACVSGPPKPAVSEYVKTESSGFTVERGAGVKYSLTYTLLKSIGEHPSLKAEFENPMKNGATLIVEKAIVPDERTLVVSSARLPCIVNGQKYNVVLTLYSNGVEVAKQHDKAQFDVPPSLFDELDIAVCE
jgi:hypothetical protein